MKKNIINIINIKNRYLTLRKIEKHFGLYTTSGDI